MAQTNMDILTSDYDTHLSGSTLVSLLIKNNKITCGNVGDSRAIIVKH